MNYTILKCFDSLTVTKLNYHHFTTNYKPFKSKNDIITAFYIRLCFWYLTLCLTQQIKLLIVKHASEKFSWIFPLRFQIDLPGAHIFLRFKCVFIRSYWNAFCLLLWCWDNLTSLILNFTEKLITLCFGISSFFHFNYFNKFLVFETQKYVCVFHAEYMYFKCEYTIELKISNK